MSVTIIESPSTITPAFNPVTYVVNSTRVADTNHRFVAVVKDGEGFVIQRLEFVGHPSYDNGFIDISRVVTNYLTYDIDFEMTAVNKMLKSIKEIEVEFGEMYDIAGVPTEFLNQVTSTIYVTNIGLSTYDWLNYSSSNYIGTILNKNTTQLRIDSNAWLYFYHENANSVDQIRVTANNGITDTISLIGNPYNVFTDWEDGYCYLPSGANLNDIATLDWGTPGSVVPLSTINLKLELLNGATVLDTHSYTIVDTCYSNYELYYLTNVGAFETLVLNKAFHKTKDLQRESAGRVVGGLTSNTTYGYNSYDPGGVDWFIGFTEKWKLNTDWISELQSANYFQLVSSPVIFLNDNGTIKRVKIALTNYKEKTERTDRLFNFEIEVMESQKQERQWVN